MPTVSCWSLQYPGTRPDSSNLAATQGRCLYSSPYCCLPSRAPRETYGGGCQASCSVMTTCAYMMGDFQSARPSRSHIGSSCFLQFDDLAPCLASHGRSDLGGDLVGGLLQRIGGKVGVSFRGRRLPVAE